MVVMIENDWNDADVYSYFVQCISKLKSMNTKADTQEIAYYKLSGARVFYFNDIYAFADSESKVSEIYIVRGDKAKIQYINTIECAKKFKPLAQKIREYFAVLHTVISSSLETDGVRYKAIDVTPAEFRALLIKESSI
jgi:hypothetical protein